jgi:hypothetical protein
MYPVHILSPYFFTVLSIHLHIGLQGLFLSGFLLKCYMDFTSLLRASTPHILSTSSFLIWSPTKGSNIQNYNFIYCIIWEWKQILYLNKPQNDGVWEQRVSIMCILHVILRGPKRMSQTWHGIHSIWRTSTEETTRNTHAQMEGNIQLNPGHEVVDQRHCFKTWFIEWKPYLNMLLFYEYVSTILTLSWASWVHNNEL